MATFAGEVDDVLTAQASQGATRSLDSWVEWHRPQHLGGHRCITPLKLLGLGCGPKKSAGAVADAPALGYQFFPFKREAGRRIRPDKLTCFTEIRSEERMLKTLTYTEC
jgi:hypothetical protein